MTPIDQDTKTKPKRRWLWAIFIALILLPGSGIAIVLTDEDPPDDSDLLAPLPSLPLQENAILDFRTLMEKSYIPADPETFRVIDEWNDAMPFPRKLIAKHFAANEDFFKQIAELAGSKAWEIPTNDFELETVEKLRKITSWLYFRSLLQADSGHGNEALATCLTVLQIASSLKTNAQNLFEWSYATNLQVAVISYFENVLELASFTDADLVALDQRLRPFLTPVNRLPQAKRGNYTGDLRVFESIELKDLASMVDTITPFDSESASKPPFEFAGPRRQALFFQRNRCRRLLAEIARQQILYLENQDPDYRVELERLSRFERLLTGNAFGREAVRELALPKDRLDALLSQQARARKAFEVLLVAIAARRFRLTEGRDINALTELCPRFLKAIPKDFNGKPLLFRKEFKTIFSYGPDCESDAIAYGTQWANGEDDISVSIRRRDKP